MKKLRNHSLSYETYFNKVYGGWIGKCIGGAIGARVEGIKKLHDFDESNVFPEEWPPNDDLDLQVLWLYVLKNKGIYIRSKDLADAWHKYSWYYFNEYGRFLKNYDKGIYPPTSGWFDNNFFRESMGSPIRSEIWGFINPGNPDLAADYAGKDAVLDHWKNSVWAEQFFAAIESSVFFIHDIEELIKIGLKYVPVDSKLHKVITLVQKLRSKKVEWREARKEVLRYFGHPDFTSVFQNIGFILISLLWGEYDFANTMLIAINSGYDTDCTCATSGAILGAILGADKIPKKWKEPISDKFVMGFKIPWKKYSIKYLAEETCKIGVLLSKTLNKKVRIFGFPKNIFDTNLIVGNPRRVEIDINYVGLPVITYNKSSKVKITIRNNRDTDLKGKLLIKLPEKFECLKKMYRININPNESKEVFFTIKFKGDILHDKNIFTVVLEEQGNKILEEKFGLSGSRIWRLKGPYWTSKDWITDIADISYEYIDEKNFVTGEYEKAFRSSIVISSEESLLPLENILPLYGEYCVYLYTKIFSPENMNVDLVMGASGDTKIWFNEEFKGLYRGSYIWNPVMYHIPISLKTGINNLVIKYVKKCNKPFLSIDFHRPNKEKIPGYSIWLTDLGSIL